MTAAIIALLAVATGCNRDPPAGTADLLGATPDLRMKSGIGDPCMSVGGSTQGTCNAGQVCLPDNPQLGTIDGYCTAICSNNQPCPSDATCLNNGGFSICMLDCDNDADCRVPDYACQDAGGSHKVCVPINQSGNGGGVPAGTNDGGACVLPRIKPADVDGGVFGRNVQLSGAGQSLEAEVELAVDRANQHIVVSWNTLTGNGQLGVIHSGDDGMTWDKARLLPPDTTVDKNREQSDPVVAVDGLGDFYVSWVGFDRSQQNPNPTNMHVWVAKSTNNGAAWSNVHQVSPDNEWAQGGFLDKPWIGVNPLDDSLVVTWDQAASQVGPVNIRMARSTDGGKTWSAPMSVNDPGKRAQIDRNLAQIAFNQAGAGYIVWVEIDDDLFGSTQNAVYLQAFNPDGTMSGANVKVTAGADSPVFDDPSVAADRDNVYVGFISGTPRGVWDVRVAASLDGGATFTPSVKANDDPSCATHFHHQIVTDENGNVHAAWYDNRYLDGNVFYAWSPPADRMNKLGFGRNQFVNDVAFTFTTRRDMANWLGDYLGLWSAGNEIYAAWTDNRAANRSHIYFARGKSP